MKLPTWGWAALAGGILIGLTVHLVWQGNHDQRLREWTTSKDSLLAVGVAQDAERVGWLTNALLAEARADSLGRAARLALSNVSRETARTERLHRNTVLLRDSLVHAVDSVPVLLSIVAGQDSTIESQGLVITDLQIALTDQIMASAALRVVVESARAQIVQDGIRIQGLEHLLQTAPIGPPKLLGFLPIPSRPVMFVIGVAAGVLATR